MRTFERSDAEFQVRIASSYDSALDQLNGQDVDCIVADYELPDRNGLALLEAV